MQTYCNVQMYSGVHCVDIKCEGATLRELEALCLLKLRSSMFCNAEEPTFSKDIHTHV